MNKANNKNINVVITEDSSIIRGMLFEMLSKCEDIAVIGAVENGELCLKKLEQEADVHVVTLDIDMPVMDGLMTLKEIRRRFPDVKVIMLSSLTQKGSKATFDALAMGACDFIPKPTSRAQGGPGLKEVESLLIEKIRALAPRVKEVKEHKRIQLNKQFVDIKPEILVIGSSTGGPDALSKFFKRLPKDINIPVLIAQHMPPLFTKYLAERLAKDSGLSSKEAQDKEMIRPGTIYVAPGDFHMMVKREDRNYFISLNQTPHVNHCRPAVDPLFQSAAQVFGAKVLGVVFTGMGHDGRNGSKEIVNRGGVVIAQDEASSVVWGMPGAVSNAGLASAVLPIEELADYVKGKIL